jgi:hypothetical protein
MLTAASPVHSFAAAVLIQVKVNLTPRAAYVSRRGSLDAASCSKAFPSQLETNRPVKIACLAPLVALR